MSPETGVAWEAMLACPLCSGLLSEDAGGLRCPADETTYPIHESGLLDLRLPYRRTEHDAFAAAYRAARLAEGWQPLTPDLAQALPQADPPGFPRLYWPLRRESWAHLTALLAGLGPAPLPIADAGAGFPWLSHRLASLGHVVIAFDVSADADFGLGATRFFPTAIVTRDSFRNPTSAGSAEMTQSSTVSNDTLLTALRKPVAAGQFLPVLGDLEWPPLAPGAFAAVICNASLHYAADLPAVVSRLARALRPGGALLVVDSPISSRGRAGDRPGSRVLGRDEVEAALRAAGLTPAWHPVRRGALWWRHRLKTWLLRRPGFEFPIVVGRA